jgi:murein DD-endopeptidase MepM/ murein hydrolase activator NlpD
MACGGGSDATTATLTRTPTLLPTPSPTPAATPSPTPGPYLYTVKDGDVLGAIADLFSVSIEELLEANDLPDETSLTIGQQLVIPGVTATPRPTPGPTSTTTDNLLGMHLIMPLAGACLTPDDEQMPNSLREYRSGIHEGVDFFTGFACIDVPRGLEIHAVADGRIIRADHDYRQLTQSQIDELEAESAAQGFTSPGTLDKFRGRQVWIDHGDGVITRYCHMDGIPRDINVGSEVKQGDVIGYVGDSGTPESASNPDIPSIHLHFEIRVDDSYLGAGLGPAETRAVYEAIWGIQTEPAP